MMIPNSRLLVPLLILLSACAPEPAWRDLDPEGLTSKQQAQLAAARRACKQLGEGLKTRLLAAINKDGPAAAIDVCRIAAPEITAGVAEQAGLRIGRTSHRLRNPANAPPEWAAAAVGKAVARVHLRSGPNERLGALLPIPMAGVCVACHGAPANITPAVQAALQKHYPADRATGFAPEELRGYFWVEVGGGP